MASSAANDFGWNVLNHLAKDKGNDNLFLSPYSISVALAMARLGAKGKTAEGMEKALCWTGDGGVIHKDFQKLIAFLKRPSDCCILRTANRIYIDRGYFLEHDFLTQVQKFYMTGMMFLFSILSRWLFFFSSQSVIKVVILFSSLHEFAFLIHF